MELIVPVAFIIFNRLDVTKQVFSSIQDAKPKKLYIISDAARPDVPGEAEKVEETRRYVEENINWKCEIHKNYAQYNIGCKYRVASGISWVLQQEENVIILEDDCLPMPSFFEFCQVMLDKYKDDKRILMISGSNHVKDYNVEKDYIFSYFPSIWGWATWRRAWKKYDIDIEKWPQVKKEGCFKNKLSIYARFFERRNFEKAYNHQIDTWDYQWEFARLYNDGLGIVPKVNLINNLGFGRMDATHTKGTTLIDFSCGNLTFPLNMQDEVTRDVKYDKLYQKDKYGIKRVISYLRNKI